MKCKYTDEEKQKIIYRYISGGESSANILADTGIPKSTFYSWLKAYREKQVNSKRKPINIRNFHLLENKVVRLEGIIEILQSVTCTAKSPLKEKLYAAEQLYGKYNVHMLCDALDIPRGTFYNHIFRNKKDNTWYSKRKEELRMRIQEIYDENNQILGAGKIAAVMRSEGVKVSEEMVRTLMRDMGIGSIRQIAKKLYEEEKRKHKNYLNQEFDPNAPNEVWVSDVTYFKFHDKAFYICVVIDLYARLVISYKVGKKNSTQLVKSTFQQAYSSRRPPADLIFHTDRGFNYTSKTMDDCLKSLNVTHSFSRPYVPYDNSVMESFFSSMKREELYRTKYNSEKEFRDAVDKYIIFYNTKRPHKKLQYKTPEQKEQEYALKQAYPDGKWNDTYINEYFCKHFICEWDNTYSNIIENKHESESHNHIFKSEIVEPTCLKNGYTKYSCEICHYFYTGNYTSSLGHNYQYSRIIAPTCTEKGYDLYTCTKCNKGEKAKYVDALGHNYKFTKTVAPTCTAQGYDLYTCVHCNGTEKRNTVSAIGHNYIFTKTVLSTCTTDGYDLYTCTTCNATEKRNVVSSTGHTYEVVTNTATCTAAGIKTSVCSKCADEKEENVSALGHTYSKVYTAPTCTEANGYTNTCKRCGDITYDFYAAKGHDYGEIVGQDYVNKIAGSTISANPNYFNEFYHTSTSIGSNATGASSSTNMAVPNEIRLGKNDLETVTAYQFAIKSGLFFRQNCNGIFAYNANTGRPAEQSAIPYTDRDGNLVNMHYIDYKTNNSWVSGRYVIENNKIVDSDGNIVCDNFTETRPHIVYTKSEALKNGVMNSDGTVNVNAELIEQYGVSFSAGIPGVYFTATNIASSTSRRFVDVFGFDANMQGQIKSGKYDVNLCFYNPTKNGLSKTTFKIYDGSLIQKTPATLTEDERIEYTCMDCGERHTETCSLNLADFKIAAASVSLANNIRMNYKVLKTAVDDFENPYIEVMQNGKTVKITEYMEQGNYYVFSYRNIAPQCLGDTLTAVLCGTHNGILYSSNSLDFSVKEYAYRMLQVCEPEQYSSLRTLLVDMLNYGSAAQAYMNYNADQPVNADLTEQQKSWASNDDLLLANIANPNYKEIENASVVWKGAGLSLYDSISVRYTFTAENINDLSLRVTCNDRVWNYSRDDIIDNGNGTYSVLFTDLNADQMSDAIYITAYNSDMEVSNTLCYSVESYAALVHSSMPNSVLENLTKAMIKYGNSAKKYAM